MNYKLALLGLTFMACTACQETKIPVEPPTVFSSANPYMPVWEYIPDGEPYVFEDPDNPGKFRVYVYGSHDMLQKTYCGLDQVVWSAPIDDLTNWRLDGTIFELTKNANGENLNEGVKGDLLFAPDVTVTTDENGKKTYWLFPNNMAKGRRCTVAKSDRPNGPFQVCNWNQDGKTTYGVLDFDPGVFVDDDGRVYGYWGFGTSHGAELDPTTMCTVKSGTEIVTNMIPGHMQEGVERFFEASSMRKIKDKYVFVYSRKTAEGENGAPSANSTLAYCYSDHPLGPWTYGGTLIDIRGLEKQEDGSTIWTAIPNGNTHGSLCEINGQWYVFYHRQTGIDEYSRQAMVSPVTVEVSEGEGGAVRISQAEYTSEGFNIQGLDPFNRYPAGIACYFVGPEPSSEEHPNFNFTGSYIGNSRNTFDKNKNPYDVTINRSTVVNNTSGSTVGYKYFNLDKTHGKKNIKLMLNYQPEGVAGTMDIYVDQPNKGGKKVQTLEIPAQASEAVTVALDLSAISDMSGKHALFLEFHSNTENQSLCVLNDFYFTAE